MEQVFDLRKDRANWWILESTASTEIDIVPKSTSGPTNTEQALSELAHELSNRVKAGGSPNLTVFVHGYSNDGLATMARIGKAQVETDKAPLKDDDAFWIGYRWPSERIFSAAAGTVGSAHPGLILGLVIGALFTGLGIWLKLQTDLLGSSNPALQLVLAWVCLAGGWGAFCFLIGYAFIRAIVYFRDSYRAINYGALDLVEFVRRLDRDLCGAMDPGPETPRVDLSFVGHSMGAMVVTTAIRILSDVFAPGSILRMQHASKPPEDPKQGTAPEKMLTDSVVLEAVSAPDDGFEENLSPDLGNCLSLLRFVLVSPDIPALALVTGRANFLGPSIRRCGEAYLVSNGGDVVLSLISIAGHYIDFPARWYRNSARLGNVQIISSEPGIFLPSSQLHDSLRVGPTTLAALERSCAGVAPRPLQVAGKFTYIDCTGFTDQAKGQCLSYLKGAQKPNLFRQLRGLLGYIEATTISRGKDCHSGYFDFPDTLQLIFGCAGFGLLGLRDRLVREGVNIDEQVKTKGFRICPGSSLGAKPLRSPVSRGPVSLDK